APVAPAAATHRAPTARPKTWRQALVIGAVTIAGMAALAGVAVLVVRAPGGGSTSASASAAAAPVTAGGTSGTAAPSAAAPGALHAPGGEGEEADVAVWRARLEKAYLIKDWMGGSRAFLALAKQDPAVLDSAENRARIIAVAAGIAFEGKNELG